MKLGSDIENKSDIGCRFGSAFWCPHNPVCIWADVNGELVPCRNNPLKATCSCALPCKIVLGLNDYYAARTPIHLLSGSKKQKLQ